MSVVLGDRLLASGRVSSAALAGLQDFALAELSAAFIRTQCRQGVYRNPTAAEPEHALVEGPKTESVKKKMAKQAVWIIPPSVCCLHGSTGVNCPTCP
jgi:hypothetical protein